MSNAQTLKSLLETNAALKAELANLRELSTARQPLPPALGAAAGGADESTTSKAQEEYCSSSSSVLGDIVGLRLGISRMVWFFF
jgi:hypothetical protein